MTTITPELRAQLEKIAWKHYDPQEDNSLNVEEMLDEMAPVLAEREALARAEERERVQKDVNEMRYKRVDDSDDKTGWRKKGKSGAYEHYTDKFTADWHNKILDELLALLTQTSNTDL